AVLERIKQTTHDRVMESRINAAAQFSFALQEEQTVAAHHHQVDLSNALALAREEFLRGAMATQRVVSALEDEESQQRAAEAEVRRMQYARDELVRDIERKIVLARQQKNKELVTILQAELGLATMEPLATAIPNQIRSSRRSAAGLIWSEFLPKVLQMRAMGAKNPKVADM